MRLFLCLFLLNMPGICRAQMAAVPDMARRLGASTSRVAMYAMGASGTGQPAVRVMRMRTLTPVQLPPLPEGARLSYGTEFSRAVRDSNALLIVQAILPDSSRLLMVDRNQDFDLRNDGPPLRLTHRRHGRPADTARLHVDNVRVPGAYVLYDMYPLIPKDNLEEATLIVSASENLDKRMAPVRDWLWARQRNMVAAPLADGQTLYLTDGNSDGVFGNSHHDHAALAAPGLRVHWPSQYRSPNALKAGTVLRQYGREGWLRIASVDTLTGRVVLSPGAAPTEGPYVGQPFKDHRLPTLNDTSRKVALSSLFAQADYTLLDVWGYWCKGCLQNFPRLDSLHRRFSPRLQIVGIATSGRKDSAYLAEHPHPWQQLRFKPIRAYLDPQAYPTYLLVNRQGILVEDDLDDIEKRLASGR